LLETVKQAKAGSIVPLYRELDKEIDAVEYFAKLSNYGKKKNSLLFEDKNRSIGTSNPCILLTGKGNEFEIKALNDIGKKFLQFIKKDFGFCDKVVNGREKIHGILNPSRRNSTEDQRIKLKTHIDIIRVVASKFKANDDVIGPTGLMGIVSYDFINNIEDLPENSEDLLDDADYMLYFMDNMFIVDHNKKKTYFISNALITDNKRDDLYKICNKSLNSYEKLVDKKLPKQKKLKKKAFDVKYNRNKNEFLGVIKNLKRNIINGEIVCATPSRMAVCTYNAEPLDFYSKMKNGKSTFYICEENGVSIGSAFDSLKVQDNKAELRIATTVSKRGYVDGEMDHDLDNKFETVLRIGENETVKHTILVDVARNEIAKISNVGTRYMDKLFAVEKQENEQKVVSNIKGELKEGLDSLHVFNSTLNVNAGVPKLSAMKLLRKVENTKRGFHFGSLLNISCNKNLDSKTIDIIRIKKDKAYVRAGSYVSQYCNDELVAENNEKKLSKFVDMVKEMGGFK